MTTTTTTRKAAKATTAPAVAPTTEATTDWRVLAEQQREAFVGMLNGAYELAQTIDIAGSDNGQQNPAWIGDPCWLAESAIYILQDFRMDDPEHTRGIWETLLSRASTMLRGALALAGNDLGDDQHTAVIKRSWLAAILDISRQLDACSVGELDLPDANGMPKVEAKAEAAITWETEVIDAGKRGTDLMLECTIEIEALKELVIDGAAAQRAAGEKIDLLPLQMRAAAVQIGRLNGHLMSYFSCLDGFDNLTMDEVYTTLHGSTVGVEL